MEESTFLNPARTLEYAGLEEGMKVADLGAGSGFFTRAAARRVGEGGVVWAVDLNRELLSRIKNFAAVEELHNVEVLHGDAEVVGGTGLPSDTFDFVIATNLLFAVENRGECAAEIRRILKKSGRALVVDWQDSFSGLGPHAGHVITAAAGQRLLEQQGMVLVAKVPAGAYHWGLVVRKKSA